MNRKIYTLRAVLYNKKTVLRPSVRQTTHPFCKCLFNQLIVSAAYKLIYFLLIEKDKLLCTTQLSRFFLQMALTQSINQSAGKSTITITKLPINLTIPPLFRRGK